MIRSLLVAISLIAVTTLVGIGIGAEQERSSGKPITE
jgi:hypothetical protein